MQEPEPESNFLRWVREHAVLFGIYVGLAFGFLLLFSMWYDLPLVDIIMGQNIGWVRLFAYTLVIFILLAKYCRARRPFLGFWTFFLALFMLHLVCFVWIYSKIKPLGAIHYVALGPFEFLLLYFLLNHGTRHLGTGQDNE
jgi:hypothetical protein